MSIKRLSGAGLTTPKSNKLWDQTTFQSGMFALATVVVPSGGTSSISFSSIPNNYTHLQVRLFAKYTGTGYGYLTVNSDSGSNYSNHGINGNGVSSDAVGAFNLANATSYYYTNGAGTKDTTFNAAIIDILDYSNTTKNKTFRGLYCWDNNGTGYVEFNSGSWRNASSAISSMTLTSSAGNFTQYSHVALYGIRSA